MIYKDKKNLNHYLNDKKNWLILFVVTFALFWFRMPPVLPLYYSQVIREDKLANSYELLIIPFFVYLAFVVADKWLYPLALENKTVKEIIRFFLLGFAIFAYAIFLKILLLVS